MDLFFDACLLLLKNNYKIIGIDNLNNYYDVDLKKNRLKILVKYKNFKFVQSDIENKNLLKNSKKIK